MIRHIKRIQNRPSRNARVRGVVTLEFIFALPFLFITTLAIFEFAFLGLVIQAASTAVIEGTREGSKAFPSGLVLDNNVGTTSPLGDDDIADKIALVIDEYLATHNIEVRETGIGDDVNEVNAYVRINRGGTIADRGDATLSAGCTTAGTAPSTSEIVVTICFPLVRTTNPTGPGTPVPNWLSTFGVDISSLHFEMSSRASLN